MKYLFVILLLTSCSSFKRTEKTLIEYKTQYKQEYLSNKEDIDSSTYFYRTFNDRGFVNIYDKNSYICFKDLINYKNNKMKFFIIINSYESMMSDERGKEKYDLYKHQMLVENMRKELHHIAINQQDKNIDCITYLYNF